MSTAQRDNVVRWIPVAVTILTNLVIIAYGYGQLNQRVIPLERHTERAQIDFVSRVEFNSSVIARDREIADIKDMLKAQDAKLDRLLERSLSRSDQ